jgi:hypothetical protein
MGRYATSTSISLLLPNWLSTNTTTGDTYGTNIWSLSSDQAEGEVNASLVARYDPSTWTSTGSPAIPPLVIKLTQDLACLYAVRAAMTQDTQIKNANWDSWERAHQTLQDIRDGLTKLTYTDGSLVPTRSTSKIISSTISYPHIFALDNERSWNVGANQIDDIKSERGITE